MKKNILICDDEDSTTRTWEAELRAVPEVQANFEVVPMPAVEFGKAMAELEERQRAQRNQTNRTDEPIDIDTADLLIVDFDLLNLKLHGGESSSETGERLAYLARVFSRCGYIVALNQFDKGMTSFDLTLRGHPESFADLNISSQQLANPGLWSNRRAGFRPWSWPCLSEAAARFETRVAVVADNFDQPILDVLGLLDDNVLAHFTRSQLRFLTRDDPRTVTFEQFVAESDSALRGKDVQTSEPITHRMAAARIHKWLERMVLPRQDLLVDAPHLASRYPSLVGENPTDVDAWNSLAAVCADDVAAAEQLPVAAGTFDWRTWLSRPAWLWPHVQHDETIAEVIDPWGERFAEYRFCEDVSAFASEEHTRDFTSDSDSSWSTRWVIDPATVGKGHEWVDGPFGVLESDGTPRVRYRPLVQFSI